MAWVVGLGLAEHLLQHHGRRRTYLPTAHLEVTVDDFVFLFRNLIMVLSKVSFKVLLQLLIRVTETLPNTIKHATIKKQSGHLGECREKRGPLHVPGGS